MADRVSLALVIHNHQPVGNFGWVVEDVYEHAYSPLLHALERHPAIHLGLHYTGPLLQWMAANRPESIDQIRGLVARGQVEIVGGAYYEPILVTLPDRDRHGQLVRMRDELETLFGRRPSGAWLAERVWEPSLAYDLAEAGYGWTVLDDNHLRAASISEDAMWTAFTTDDRGKRLTVFGTEQGLRYRIPFKPVEDLISYLHVRARPDGRFVGMMGDDGEKFGSWPGTFEYCWSRERWVDRCFEAIAASGEWLATVTPSEWLAVQPPTARVYFPTASYVEMTEWVLPPAETPVFVELLEDARARDLPAARFLRGGFWRNYMARYREVNDLHKQMLRASDAVEAMPGAAGSGTGAGGGPAGASALKARALDHLYQGQSNDCYWHGLFGGIYIVHMRMATLAHLIAAEDLADIAAEASGGEPYGARLADTDMDAIDEAIVNSAGQTIVVDLAEGAGISSWDLRASRVALASALRRRPEAYHEKLIARERAEKPDSTAVGAGGGAGSETDAAAGGRAGAAAADAPRTIHDVVATKEPGLAALLHYDRHERRSGLVHLLPTGGATDLAAFVGASYEELGDFTEAAFEPVVVAPDRLVARRLGSVRVDGVGRPLIVEKTFRFGGDRSNPTLALELSVENPDDLAVAFELAVEWNVDLLGGGHNPAAYYEAAGGGRTPHDAAGDLRDAAGIAFGNDYEGVRIEAVVEPAARLTWYPIETVSNSEGGFERAYQGSSLLFRWPASVAPGERGTFAVRFAVTQTIDHTAAELA
ncbi:MAG: alpha-amylase/4-alpha-glucanotransferase domain-containing protein [Candidatus Limnocylindrales bacterium]